KGEKTGERPELTEEQKAEMQAKMEAFKANWENWDNLTIAEKKALIDEADAMMCPHHHGPRPEEKPAE
ncbi:MAG: hypothetical protein Q4D14_07555, partial [Bacteroidales bacterium]|nr:hypothetical protein [Bacteroidales bacterium]